MDCIYLAPDIARIEEKVSDLSVKDIGAYEFEFCVSLLALTTEKGAMLGGHSLPVLVEYSSPSSRPIAPDGKLGAAFMVGMSVGSPMIWV